MALPWVLGLTLATLSWQPALAQYKWVAPDGTVTYGDRPPPQATPLDQPARTTSARRAGDGVQAPGGSGASPDAGLPYELRLAAQRHPVTLYTTPDCQPCTLARSHLLKRGIPFATREVRTQEDAAAFAALGFVELSFPALGVGNDRASGFEAGRWDRLLDSAGYPKTSRLPPRWQAPRAEALAPPVIPGPAPVAPSAQEQAAGTAVDVQEAASGAGIDDTANVETRRTRASASEQPAIRF